MKNLNTIIAVAALTTCAAFAGTFQTIKFTQETHSDTDPFGVQALATVSQKVETVETTVGTISTKMETVEGKVTQLESKDLTPDIANEVKKQLTNNTDVVIGQVSGTSDDIGLVAKNNSIVLAVKRDMEEIETTEGSITFAADKIQLGALDSIYVGNQTLQALLATAGDKNVIEEIQVNGVKVTPENKVVNLPNFALKSEIPSLDDYALKGDIPSLVGYAKTDDIPSIAGLASETFVTNKLDGYIKKSDVSSAASTAIAGINGATTIEEIQIALTNFLHTLVITPAP